jgi:acetylornithine deacetylase/succinyl-diaminopimelate desuccinylase family protein
MNTIAETLGAMIRLNTVNPAYGDGGSEANLAPFLRSFFATRDIETFEQEVFPGRNNVIARLPGSTARRLILEAHTDTVSVKGMTIPPFEPTLREGRIYGRGAVDDKGGLAAMLHAVASIKADRLVAPCEVWLAAVVDEEFSYRGVVQLCENLEAEAAIVAEPTDLRVVIASKGVLRLRITVLGRTAHSSKPHLGNNAITHMARLVLGLEQENAQLAGVSHRLVGSPTVSVGVIGGGVQVNSVPDRCSIEIDRRLLPGEKAESALAEYESLLWNLKQAHPGFDGFVETPPLLVDEGLDTPEGSEVVEHARRVLRQLGHSDEVCGVPFGSDASKLSRAGVPAIVFGPGSIDQAHSVDEYVELAAVEKAAAFYREFILSF